MAQIIEVDAPPPPKPPRFFQLAVSEEELDCILRRLSAITPKNETHRQLRDAIRRALRGDNNF